MRKWYVMRSGRWRGLVIGFLATVSFSAHAECGRVMGSGSTLSTISGCFRSYARNYSSPGFEGLLVDNGALYENVAGRAYPIYLNVATGAPARLLNKSNYQVLFNYYFAYGHLIASHSQPLVRLYMDYAVKAGLAKAPERPLAPNETVVSGNQHAKGAPTPAGAKPAAPNPRPVAPTPSGPVLNCQNPARSVCPVSNTADSRWIEKEKLESTWLAAYDQEHGGLKNTRLSADQSTTISTADLANYAKTKMPDPQPIFERARGFMEVAVDSEKQIPAGSQEALKRRLRRVRLIAFPKDAAEKKLYNKSCAGADENNTLYDHATDTVIMCLGSLADAVLTCVNHHRPMANCLLRKILHELGHSMDLREGGTLKFLEPNLKCQQKLGKLDDSIPFESLLKTKIANEESADVWSRIGFKVAMKSGRNNAQQNAQLFADSFHNLCNDRDFQDHLGVDHRMREGLAIFGDELGCTAQLRDDKCTFDGLELGQKSSSDPLARSRQY
jgi:hypothetical protein